MKPVILKLILAVSGYTIPVAELGSTLSQIAPVEIEVIDLANPQPDLYQLHYSLVEAHAKAKCVVYLHQSFTGGLSGGKANLKFGIANVGIVEGYDERNRQVILHEIGHCVFRLKHNLKECSVMSPQPCGLSLTVQEVLRGRRNIKRGKV